MNFGARQNTVTTALTIPLNTTPEQGARLVALQRAFAEVCNALAPVVRETRCWNRVALHHMTYRGLRERFPQLGSQMICNAIYSVCRTSRLLYQSPGSPFNIARLGSQPLPLVRFADAAPVYFDRHTLSLKGGRLSMFTLDGRMKFDLGVTAEDERRFREGKLQEVVLTSRSERFNLQFLFADAGNAVDWQAPPGRPSDAATPLPDYLVVQSEAAPTLSGEAA